MAVSEAEVYLNIYHGSVVIVSGTLLYVALALCMVWVGPAVVYPPLDEVGKCINQQERIYSCVSVGLNFRSHLEACVCLHV